MEVQCIIPCGPGHEDIVHEAAGSAYALGYDVMVVDDTEGKFGRSKARNHGVKIATAEWLFFLDADDVMHKDAKKAKKYTEYDAIFGLINDGKVKIPQVRNVDLKTIIQHEPTQTLQMGHFIKREVAKTIPFDESMDCGEDFKYYLQLWSKHRCTKIPHSLFVNRRGNHSTGPRSADGAQWRTAVQSLQEEWRLSLLTPMTKRSGQVV
jgi:glycosyltransferase involved in cell wall biosynthesis